MALRVRPIQHSAVSSPGEAAQVGAVVADDVDVVAQAVPGEMAGARAIEKVGVIVLDHDVVRSLRIQRATVLRMHVGPCVAMDDDPDRGL